VSKRANGSKGDAAVVGIGAVVMAEMETGNAVLPPRQNIWSLRRGFHFLKQVD
jgi:hypothetical protein